MSPQVAFHGRFILTFTALAWFFSFIVCVSQGIIYIHPAFTKVLICKIFFHHRQVWNVVPSVLSVSNWENEDCGFEAKLMKVRVIAEDKMKYHQTPEGGEKFCQVLPPLGYRILQLQMQYNLYHGYIGIISIFHTSHISLPNGVIWWHHNPFEDS